MNSFNALKKIYSRRAEIKNLPHIKVAVVGDTATQFLAMAIYGTGVERGFDIELFEAEYNQVERQFLDKASDYIGLMQIISLFSSQRINYLLGMGNVGMQTGYGWLMNVWIL